MTSQFTGSTADSTGQIQVFPSEPGIGVLVISPPYVIGYKPLSDNALGVNYSMVHSDLRGLLVYILTYLQMTIGDQIDVFLGPGTTPVASFSVTDKDFDAEGNAKNIPFYIPVKTMENKYPQPGNLPFRFGVKRLGGNEEKSTPFDLFYKSFPPGDPDTDGGKPFNQGLPLPIASETIIDQNVIAEGMTVTVLAYLHQAMDDVVELAFGPLALFFTVTDPTADIVFDLTPELLGQLSASDVLIVRYQLTDKVHNQSGWSDALKLQAKPGVTLLSAPVVELADEFNVVNHDTLAGNPMSVLVTGVFATDDEIVLTLAGFTHSGEPVTHAYRKTLSSSGRTVFFDVENERVQALIRGALRLTYVLTKKSTGKPQHSKPADITISGSSSPLRAPTVEQAVADELPADTAMAQVLVPSYWPLKVGATVKLYWQVTGADGVMSRFIFGRTATDPSLPITFDVAAKYIAPYAGQPLTVHCDIANPGKVAVTSELLQLVIGEEAKLELLPPFLVKPAVSPIDVLAYPEGVTMRIEYLGARDGDRARLVEVNAPAGSPQFPLVAFNSNKRVNTKLTPEFLAARQGKEIDLRWNLNRGGGQAGKSPVVELSVLKIADGDIRLPTPTIDRASGQELDVTRLLSTDPITVAPWLHFWNELVSLTFEGTRLDGTGFYLEFLKNEPSTPPGLNKTLPIEELKKLKNGSTLKISFTVSFNDSTGKTTVIFPERKYNIVNVVLEENFDSTPVQSIGIGQTIETPSMTIRILSANATLKIADSRTLTTHFPVPQQQPGRMEKHVLFLDSTNTNVTISLSFKAAYSRISFWYNQTKSTTTVFFLGTRGVLGQQSFNSNESPSGLHNLVGSYPGIIGIEIRGNNDAYLLDHFQFDL
ncbi:hypothetical protein [Pseudomonas sp. ANT_H12B]|uniref:hypothetical protein n=1 Tax=Pseudomonas sp. ANT_H12B TaxID=2597348 RepID=UPI0011EF5268|nr:hypothetical protein [Pseudomonas sp. ANT_H12B]KAA0956005.1 hypothetical protein FQ185_28580 [Pseudomonas sp. ANT_H12B]